MAWLLLTAQRQPLVWAEAMLSKLQQVVARSSKALMTPWASANLAAAVRIKPRKLHGAVKMHGAGGEPSMEAVSRPSSGLFQLLACSRAAAVRIKPRKLQGQP